MMKILITIQENHISPRFDLTREVLVAESQEDGSLTEPKIILLPRSSGDELCSLIVKEDISTVICNGIEETHFDYLIWKKIKVIEGVIGPFSQALEMARNNTLKSRSILPGAKAS